jgi:hypothetical protein
MMARNGTCVERYLFLQWRREGGKSATMKTKNTSTAGGEECSESRFSKDAEGYAHRVELDWEDLNGTNTGKEIRSTTPAASTLPKAESEAAQLGQALRSKCSFFLISH